jgi:hypothetical protein
VSHSILELIERRIQGLRRFAAEREAEFQAGQVCRRCGYRHTRIEYEIWVSRRRHRDAQRALAGRGSSKRSCTRPASWLNAVSGSYAAGNAGDRCERATSRGCAGAATPPRRGNLNHTPRKLAPNAREGHSIANID